MHEMTDDIAFISYRRVCSFSTAEAIKEKLLHRHKMNVFLDVTRQDGNQVQFPEQLLRAIEKADIFICLLADVTLESEWVMREITHAYKKKKRCIPIFQEDFKPPTGSKLTPEVAYLLGFNAVHYLDKRGLYTDKATKDIAKIILNTVGKRRIEQHRIRNQISETTPLRAYSPSGVGRGRLFLMIVGVLVGVIAVIALILANFPVL